MGGFLGLRKFDIGAILELTFGLLSRYRLEFRRQLVKQIGQIIKLNW